MLLAAPLHAQAAAPVDAASALADARARTALAAMTLDEKIALLHTQFGTPFAGRPEPRGALDSAGFDPGLPRLDVPPLQETDAGLGVADPTGKTVDVTALPSGLAIGATFDTAMARAGGAAIGAEARARGFNVMLAGGANLTRDPRNGRNFEYVGEDPLLTGVIAGAAIAGIQSQGVVSTLKHFALNDQETGRVMLDAVIAESAARESDLLAFEIALEQGQPGAVMTGYNRINGLFASENPFLINNVLKGDWHFGGWVMSDWGATHSTAAAVRAGLDQESGDNLDSGLPFGAPLKAAVENGQVPAARLDDMALRVLRTRFRVAAGGSTAVGGDVDQHRAVAEAIARQGIVLLKNESQLPLPRTLHRILVVGEHADFGVLSGGGSSQVVPPGALRLPGDPPGKYYGLPKLYDPSSPLQAIRHEAPGAVVDFLDGRDHVAAAQAARAADVVILFAEQWMSEARDARSLALPFGQDDLIAAVAAANPKTVVVLQTGGPVTMPWLAAVPAVVAAWYSGTRGGQAVASTLFGGNNPSGRLPITFPRAEAQLPRPVPPDPEGTTANPGEPIRGPTLTVDYNIEGADVGYKWFARRREAPLFPFGYGLSYTRFAHGPPTVTREAGATHVAFDVTNTGEREGIDTPQVYVESAAGLFTRRLAGWSRVALRPGETRRVSITIDPRLLARFDAAGHRWRIAAGRYRASVRADAAAAGPQRIFSLAAQSLAP